MTPNDKTDVLVYLKDLVLKMMDADAKRTRPHNEDANLMSGLLRTVPTLSHESINPLAVAAKQKLDNSVTAAATQRDDPWLLFLEDQYLLKLCFLYDSPARHKLYRAPRSALQIGKQLWSPSILMLRVSLTSPTLTLY